MARDIRMPESTESEIGNTVLSNTPAASSLEGISGGLKNCPSGVRRHVAAILSTFFRMYRCIERRSLDHGHHLQMHQKAFGRALTLSYDLPDLIVA